MSRGLHIPGAVGVWASRALRAASAPFAGAYYLVQKSREIAYRRRVIRPESAPIPVISLGNVLMGGSGKTPLTLYLAQGLLRRGLRPAVVSRGYKGAYRTPFLVVREPTGPLKCAWEECGDEPVLMASRLEGVPVIVARKRLLGVQVASDQFNCDCAVLDDGFQHLPLRRNLDIAALTGREDWMFPLGGLREPLSALERGDIFVWTGMGAPPPHLVRRVHGRPLFRAFIAPIEVITAQGRFETSALEGKRVFLASGIANPERFARTVASLGALVKRHAVFPDHHSMREADLAGIFADAGQDWVLMTEKDWVKLPTQVRMRKRTGAIRIGVRLENEDAFWPLALRACNAPMLVQSVR